MTMRRAAALACLAGLAAGATVRLPAAVTVYPTGTTIYNPAKAWSGFTILDSPDQGAVIVDMNGTVVKQWKQFAGASGPIRILPGGYVMGGTVPRPPYQETVALAQFDWNGKEVWRFDRTEEVRLANGTTVWAARHHHDWHREGSPAGYYAPDAMPLVDRGRTMILAHKNVTVPAISNRRLEDDYILEVAWDGKVLWQWLASDHVDELGFSEEARNTIRQSVTWSEARQSADWLHINAATYVGPNRWYDAGDQRFHPDNIIWSSREANIIAIIDRSGRVVWRMGPDYRTSEPLRALGQIIGQHHPHIIPKGLPGAGNLLVFDNGGQAGYGAPNPAAPDGVNSVRRISSRVLELNPVTFEKIWEYSIPGQEQIRFFSQYVSSAQRLPNGNTLVTEGAIGRIFELTAGKEIVWEYVSPYFNAQNTPSNRIFRAHRVPYDWVPQAPRPTERAVVPPNVRDFQIPPQASADEAAIRARLVAYAEARNRRDAHAEALCYTADGDFRSSAGPFVAGREAIEKQLTVTSPDYRFALTITHLRFLAPAMAIADAEVKAGPAATPGTLVGTYVMTKQGADWLIAAARIARAPGPPPAR
jgi:uncharacterized protein (TIGR02246 family)